MKILTDFPLQQSRALLKVGRGRAVAGIVLFLNCRVFCKEHNTKLFVGLKIVSMQCLLVDGLFLLKNY